MPNGFTPNGAFEGHVTAKLEDITKRLDCLPCRETAQRISNCEKKISNIEGKASVWGAVTGFIAGLLTWLIKR